ncbi:MAG: O-antigen ligase family protein [Candidatus Aegiribacteria sp.]|nr:O-antigen ligase family protein [Candidatus Aegiribacteria sp.]
MKDIPRSVITVIVGLIILGSIFLIYTNSRSSILIKEQFAVAGSALVLFVTAIILISGRKIAANRLTLPLCLSYILLIGWVIFRFYTGSRSVNAMKMIYSLIALGGLAAVISMTFTRSSRDMILWILVSASVLLSVYAMVQSLGFMIFPWDSGLTMQARSSGTLGNANLLGSFAVAMLPVGAGFLLGRERLAKIRIPVVLIFVVLCSGALIASKTRGSLIGLFAVAAFAPFAPFIRKNKRRLILVSLMLLVLIVGSIFFMQNRMEELTDTESGGTLQVRKLIWSGSLSLIAMNPVFGLGPGSFQIMFPQFRDPEYFTLGVSHNTLHSHCEYLEILVDIGIIGFLLCVTVAFFFIRILHRKRKTLIQPSENITSYSEDWTVLGLYGGVIALLSEAAVSVALRWPPSAILLAILLGLILASIPARWNLMKGKVKAGAVMVLSITAVILGCVAFPYYVASMRSGRQLFIGKDMYLTKIQPIMNDIVNTASAWNISRNDEDAGRALYYYDTAVQLADSSISWCSKCVETNPDELGGWYALGSSYVTRALLCKPLSTPMINIMHMSGRVPFDLEEADRYVNLGLAAYDSLMKRAPNYAEVHHNIVLIRTNLGDTNGALASMRTAWRLHAHNRDKYIRQSFLLAPLTEETGACHLQWLGMIGDEDLFSTMTDFKRTRYIQILLFYTGNTFLKHPDSADSLFHAFSSISDSLVPSVTNELRSGMEFQLRELENGLEIIQRMNSGDTSGLMDELSQFAREDIEILPAQFTAMGLLLAEKGEMEGARILENILRDYIIYGNYNNMIVWPGGPVDLFIALNSMLLSSDLETPEQRELFLDSESLALILDRYVFDTVSFVNSTPGFKENVPSYLQDFFSSIWKETGGPLYCYSNSMLHDDSLSVVIRDGSLLEGAYSGLTQLELENPDNPEIQKLKIAWLYILFVSFYYENPTFSSEQTKYIADGLRSSRGNLVELIGETETRYQIGSMLDGMDAVVNSLHNPLYGQVIEILKTDLVMGRI